VSFASSSSASVSGSKGLVALFHNDRKAGVAFPIAERIYSLAQEQDDPTLMIGALNALAGTLYYLCDFETARRYASRAVEIWRAGNVHSHPEDFDIPVVGCLCYQAMSEWHLGEIVARRANMDEAISLAKELKDMHALALAFAWAASLAQCQRNPAELERVASEMIELSTRYNIVYYLTVGTIYRGWARSFGGNTAEGIPWIEQGIRDFRIGGTVPFLPYYLSLKAEALHLADQTSEALEAINEAEPVAESFEGHDCCAKLHRLRAMFLASLGANEIKIEAVDSAGKKRRNNLRGILPPKSGLVRRS
jgi:tetratricopeptide (TPR) repeat protein